MLESLYQPIVIVDSHKTTEVEIVQYDELDLYLDILEEQFPERNLPLEESKKKEEPKLLKNVEVREIDGQKYIIHVV